MLIVVDDTPYNNVQGDERSFRLPYRKWRELLFVGAMVRRGELYERDPSRPLPPFRNPRFFAAGVRFRVDRQGDWILLERVED